MSDFDESEDTLPPVAPPADWSAQLLHFWFDVHGKEDWFGGGPAFDGAVSAYAGWRETLRQLPADQFTGDAATALAAIILFDQVPRNIHRGAAEAFATDDLARAIASNAVAKGLDTGLTVDQRLFLYLPFEHSEAVEDQRESLRLIGTLDRADYLAFAQKHFDIIKQFGRFPHRNAALGREGREGEEAAIAAGGHW